MKQGALNLWPGKQAISLVGITSLIAVFIALGSSGLGINQIAIVACIVTLQTVTMLWLASFLKPQIELVAKFSSALLLLVLVVIGSVRGMLIFELTIFFTSESPVSLLTRVLNSAITITIWGMIFSLVESRLQFFQDSYRRSFASRAMAIASTKKLSDGEVAKTIDEMESIQALQANLRQIASTEVTGTLSHSQLIGAAQRIRSEIEDSLRPLSQRMWFDSSAAQPKFHIWELLKESLRNLDIRWYPTSIIVTAATFLGALSIYEPLSVVIRVSFYGMALTLLLLWLEKNRLKLAGSSLRGWLILVFISIASSLVGEIAVSLLLYGKLLTTNFLLAIAGPTATIGVLWVEAAFAQMRKDWKAVSAAVEGAEPQSSRDLFNSRFAGYLHNSLQSQLAGIALALENTDPSDTKQVGLLMERLRIISNKSIGSDFASRARSPLDRMVEVASAWEGIASVRYSIPEQLSMHPKLEVAVELLEEAISNAVRHAKAQFIHISVEEHADGLFVEIRHKANFQMSRKSRLGQSWIERFSQQHSVELTANGERHLRVVL